MSCRSASTRKRLTRIKSFPAIPLGRVLRLPAPVDRPLCQPPGFLRSGAAPLVVFPDRTTRRPYRGGERSISQLLETGADLIGSHEMRVKRNMRQVHAVRYPVNASAALATSEGHTLLLPTSAGRREAIKAAGGFSTNRIFNATRNLCSGRSFS